jgi:hypothetical protein
LLCEVPFNLPAKPGIRQSRPPTVLQPCRDPGQRGGEQGKEEFGPGDRLQAQHIA